MDLLYKYNVKSISGRSSGDHGQLYRLVNNDIRIDFFYHYLSHTVWSRRLASQQYNYIGIGRLLYTMLHSGMSISSAGDMVAPREGRAYRHRIG